MEIPHEPLTTLARFYICESCHGVDGDRKRSEIGYECPRCGAPSQRALGNFPSSIDSVLGLIQEFHLSGDSESMSPEASTKKSEQNHQLAILVFFCTLGEVLLHHFFSNCMAKMGLPYEVRQRLFDDNLFVKKRIEKLFPALTGEKWNEVVKILSEQNTLDYDETVQFYISASEKRNLLLHEGNRWAVPQ